MRTLLALLWMAGSLCGATGQFMVTGTVIKAGTEVAGYEAAKAFDGNFLTSFAVTVNGAGWVGIDAGAAVTLTQLIVAPRNGDDAVAYGPLFPGVVLEGSAASDFSGAVTLYTVSAWNAGAIIFPGEYNYISLTPGAAYRYYRLRDPGSKGNVAEMRLIATVAGGVDAQTVAPVFSPGSGGYAAGTVTVTMTSVTTSATMHYTIDGSAPDCSSTTYSAPVVVTLNASTAVAVKAVACDASLATEASEVFTAYYRGYGFRAGDVEYDNTGRRVEAHAGGIIFAEGLFWRVGFNMEYSSNITEYMQYNPGLWMYSSPDLYVWTRVGQITNSNGYAHSERSHIIYNPATLKYVLWCNMAVNYASQMYAMIATADHPQGPWTVFISNYSPGGLTYKDNNIFVDPDTGIGYVVFTSTNNLIQYLYQLNSDMTAVTGSRITVSDNSSSGQPGREAPVMIKRRTTYFMITSSPISFDWSSGEPTEKYQTASDPLGPWSAVSAGSMYTRPTVGTPYQAQSTAVLKIPWLRDAYVYLADHWVSAPVTNPAGAAWNSMAGTTMTYLPLVFPTNTSISIPTGVDAPSPFNVAGRWTARLFPMGGVTRQ